MKKHINTQNNIIRIKKILPPLQHFLNLTKVNMAQKLFPMPRRETNIGSVKPGQKDLSDTSDPRSQPCSTTLLLTLDYSNSPNTTVQTPHQHTS